jgi:class 3 adenylate cyclase/tetratricopeptide (TPR) repeat protein
MDCPSCGHENRPGAAFCGECGASLPQEVACPGCGTTNPANQRFCDKCGESLADGGGSPASPEAAGSPTGVATAADPRSYTPPHLAEKILRERPSLEGERRTVTVLFADAMGFTPISEQLDQERVYSIMQGCVARMMDAVHRYEGTVTQFLGDGIMALFGAPIQHEDSARRAVAAALDMQRALTQYAIEVRERDTIDCRFRVGLNTGPVIVGSIGDNLDMDYTAIGDTINVASRLESSAEPGTAYLSDTTRRAAEDYFEFEQLGELTLKGKGEPVLAFKALREKSIRTRFEAATERGLTPLIGRKRELALLQEHFEQARSGRGQVVFLSGEAGIGKSRLMLEFRRSIGDQVPWIEGHCISYGSNIPYVPIIDLVKGRYGVEEGDDEAQIIARINEGTADWDESAKPSVPYLKYLLNVEVGDPAVLEMDAMARRAGIFDALRNSAIQNTRDAPAVLVVEDLHWVDESSQDALAAVVDVIASVPILMILTHRPGYRQPLGERAHFSRIALGHLPPGECQEMAGQVLKVGSLPPELEELITSKSEGNPFYIEELTKSLLESGVLRHENGGYALDRSAEKVSVPDTIQEVILSRIDRLEREGKEAIQLASVIGREFTGRLLQRISDVRSEVNEVLDKLKSLELIYEKAYLPEISYMFKHALTHDVAYSTLLLERRKTLHSIVAAAIEELYSDRLPEHYETLAHHYYEAREWDKALDYLMKSAQKAADAYAGHDAIAYYDRALEAAEQLGNVPLETLFEIYQGKAQVCFVVSEWDVSIQCYGDLVELTRNEGDRKLEGMALGGLGFAQTIGHDFEAADASAKEALEIADELADDGVRTGALMITTFLGILRGNVAESVAVGERVAALAQKTEQPFYECFCDELFILGYSWRSLYEEANRNAEVGVARAEEYGMTEPLAFNKWARGVALASSGRYTEAIACLDDAIQFCERIGDKAVRSRSWNTLGWVYMELHDFEQGIECNQKGLDIAHDVGDPEITINAQLNLADAAFAIGERTRATRELEELYADLPEMHEWMKWRYSQHLTHSLGEAMLTAGDAKRALALADECLALAEPTESQKNVVKGRRLRGQALMAERRLDQAEQELSTALDVAMQAGNPPQLWKTLAAVGELRLGRGDEQGSREAYREAMRVINGVADSLSNKGRQARFLASQQVRAIEASTEGRADALEMR